MQPTIISECEHPPIARCIYCPKCGTKYLQTPVGRGCLALLFAPIELLAGIYTGVSATPELDVTACHEQLLSGNPDAMRSALGFLSDLAPYSRTIRAVVEPLQTHSDQDIALRARDAIVSMDAK